ncbi:MAG: GNAT family N-acetyltransferase [Spirochaetaceae bacterium]
MKNEINLNNKNEIKVEIKVLESNEDAPLDLLLLADPSEVLLKKYLQTGKCFIAFIGNLTVGVILIMETKLGFVEVMNLAVMQEYQNHGIGKKLLLHTINEIKKGNAKHIEIGTGNPGVIQMLLYQKCGFRIIDIDFDFFRRNYPERIYENGIECRDMIRMRIDI